MGAFVLILFAHVGPLGNGNSNALTVAYFENKPACIAADNLSKQMIANTVKQIEFICAPTK